MTYPDADDPGRVGSYPAVVPSGGGYVWDEILEYRVWFSPADGDDSYSAFVTFAEARAYSQLLPGAEDPLALVRQREYIEEAGPGDYRHVRQQRVAEWPVEFLARPRRDGRTIADFFASGAPANRLEILRGQAPRPSSEASNSASSGS